MVGPGRVGLVVAAALVGCGGASPAPPGAGLAPARSELALYRDGALVQRRAVAVLATGDNRVEVVGVARSTVAGSETLRSLDDGATRAVALVRPAAAPDARVWMVVAPRPGPQRLETRYLAGALGWEAGYSVVVDDGPTAWFEGWLTITSRTGAPLTADRLVVFDGAMPAAGPASSVGLAPMAGQSMRRPLASMSSVTAPSPGPGRTALRGRRIALAGPLAIPAAASVDVPLVAGGGRAVPVQRTHVFDPIGPGLDRAGRRPVTRRDLGQSGHGRTSPVATYLELDLAAAGLDHELPVGWVAVYERRAGALAPLGLGRGFPPRASDAALAAPSRPGRLRLAVGESAELDGKREQSEYFLDLGRRRLVEEIRVTLGNRGAAPAEVRVREHLYRGLTWSLAYVNDAGPVSKEAAQEIEIRTTVPAHGSRVVVYRVVYRW